MVKEIIDPNNNQEIEIIEFDGEGIEGNLVQGIFRCPDHGLSYFERDEETGNFRCAMNTHPWNKRKIAWKDDDLPYNPADDL